MNAIRNATNEQLREWNIRYLNAIDTGRRLGVLSHIRRALRTDECRMRRAGVR
jgi:hypothetical protein